MALGGAFWAGVAFVATASVTRVWARATRPVLTLTILPPPGLSLLPGDCVFAYTDMGLVRVGEVAECEWRNSESGWENADRAPGEIPQSQPQVLHCDLAIQPHAMQVFNASTYAVCRQTPLSVEDAVEAMLPPALQRRVTDEVLAAWRAEQTEVWAIWQPIVSDLVLAYVERIAVDLESAVSAREDEFLERARDHARAAAVEWPAIQARLSPILQEHLTPVLGELMEEAASAAPKARIAWSIARGRHTRAFQEMLDWLAEYLAAMPEADKARMGDALRKTLHAAREDEVLAEHFARLGRQIRDDPRLRELLADVYREAISQNPATEAYIRTAVLESPRVRDEAYRLMERFAPTARKVTAMCLFDADGATRPEVVHLVRSIALGRRVAWVTLHTPSPQAPPLAPGAAVAVRQD